MQDTSSLAETWTSTELLSGSPLTNGVSGWHIDMVEPLLSRGANPNVSPNVGTPLAAKKQNNLAIIALLERVGTKE